MTTTLDHWLAFVENNIMKVIYFCMGLLFLTGIYAVFAYQTIPIIIAAVVTTTIPVVIYLIFFKDEVWHNDR